MGRGTICCVPGCDKNTAVDRDVSWHSFPSDENTKRDWVKRINRVGLSGRFSLWTPTKSHKICGLHFNKSGRRKYEEKVPIFFPNRRTLDTGDVSKRVPSKRGEAVREQINVEMQLSLDVPDTGVEEIEVNDTPLLPVIKLTSMTPNSSSQKPYKRKGESSSVTTVDVGLLVEERQQTWIDPSYRLRPTSDDFPDHTYAIVEPPDVKIKDLQKTIEELGAANECLQKQVAYLSHQLQLEKLKNKSLICENVNLNTNLGILKNDMNENVQFRSENITRKVAMLKFYTGFQSVCAFDRFAQFIKPSYVRARKQSRAQDVDGNLGRPQILDFDNQLLLVLSKLRLGLLENDLAFRMKISTGTVSNIFSFWVDFLGHLLVQVPIWPSKDIVNRYMPDSFKDMYPSTRIILDCTEIFIENPSDFRVQSDTYSHYKSHNTAKGLIGITPNGYISFVSDLFPGRTSDKEITRSCGLVDMLEEGDSVMADRGFIIADMLSDKNVTLNIPPFLNGKPQLSAEEEVMTREIARLRIHVERVISNIKNFKILKTVFPNSMHTKLNKIWKICCLINNFTGEPLVDRTKNDGAAEQ